MVIIRFLRRFLLVPLGGCFAALAGMVVVITANWNDLAELISSKTALTDNFILFAIWGPLILALSPIVSMVMLTLAAIGVAIAEMFAIRSILYHVANGALATWVGWAIRPLPKDLPQFSDPTFVIAGGIAAGLVYWAVAGWSSGFWKPVFSSPPDAPPTAAPAA